MTIHLTAADEYAAIKAQIDLLEAKIKVLRKEILATGHEHVEGDHCTIDVSLSERSTLDAAKAKSFLTPDQIEASTKKTLVETLRIKAKVPVAA